jgi:SOS response regulatory protein OraA/RecX
VEYQAWGRLKIQAGLQALQLPSDAIREAMDSIDESKYFDNLRHLMEQYRPASSAKTNAKTQADADKLLRFLLQRGFTYDEIKNCK